MSELKSCPLCKHAAFSSHELSKNELVFCGDALCPMNWYGVPIEKWQSRPLEDALQSSIEELEANISTLAVAIGVEGAGSELTVEHAIARIGRLQSSNAALLAFVVEIEDKRNWREEDDKLVWNWHNLPGFHPRTEAQCLIKEQK